MKFHSSIWTNLNETWSCLRTWDFGESIIPQTKATFWLFFPPPVRVSSPIACREEPSCRRRFYAGSCDTEHLRGLGEPSEGVCRSRREQSGVPQLSARPSASREPFSRNPGRLMASLFQKACLN